MAEKSAGPEVNFVRFTNDTARKFPTSHRWFVGRHEPYRAFSFSSVPSCFEAASNSTLATDLVQAFHGETERAAKDRPRSIFYLPKSVSGSGENRLLRQRVQLFFDSRCLFLH